MIQRKFSHFRFDCSSCHLVPVALGPARAEFHDVIPFQLVFKLSEVLAQRRLVLPFFVMREDDRIGVKVHHALVQSFQFLVQLEARITGGKARHKDVEVRRHVDHWIVDLVVDLYAFLGHGNHLRHLVATTGQKGMQGTRISEFPRVSLVESLTEFTPHGVQHEFRNCPSTFIHCNTVYVQFDPFVIQILLNVATSLL